MSADVADDKHLHRLILFSDAVFAIAITLLAIEIHPPEHWGGVGELFAKMSHKLAAYTVSFAVVGIYWISHRRIFARLTRADGVLDVLNFGVLGLVALLPLGTELLWEDHTGKAFLVYLGLVALIGWVLAALWGYAVFVARLSAQVSRLEGVYMLCRVALLPGLMCGLSFFSLVHPWGWAVMGLLIFVLVAGARALRKFDPALTRDET